SLGPRDAVSQAIFDEVEKGKGVLTPDGRPAVWLDTTRIAEADALISLPYMLRRYRSGGIDPLREKILTYPVLHYQNGGLVIDEPRARLRLRRDRRRDARAQPHDGQLAARVHGLRPARGQGCGGKGWHMSETEQALDPEKVKAFVANAHGDLDAVRELLAEEPALVNAAWDWGGGDWETA